MDTEIEVGTGGRLKRISKYLDGPFCMTYGDGISDIDIKKLVEFHQVSQTLATLMLIGSETECYLEVI